MKLLASGPMQGRKPALFLVLDLGITTQNHVFDPARRSGARFFDLVLFRQDASQVVDVFGQLKGGKTVPNGNAGK
jgi:hypothetical protein